MYLKLFFDALDKDLAKLNIRRRVYATMDFIEGSYRCRKETKQELKEDDLKGILDDDGFPRISTFKPEFYEKDVWIEKVILGSHDYEILPDRAYCLKISFKHERPLMDNEIQQLLMAKKPWYSLIRRKKTISYEIDDGFFIEMSRLRVGENNQTKVFYEIELELKHENSAKKLALDEKKSKREMYEIIAGEFIKTAIALQVLENPIAIREIPK